MRKMLFVMIGLMLCYSAARAQSQDPPKYEVGVEFTTLPREGFFESRTEVGVGGRFTFNLNPNIALETVAYVFPRNCFDCRNEGRMTEVLGGVKAGKRFDSWGVFAKARPGFVAFSRGQNFITPAGPNQIMIETSSATNFAADLGAVLEFYPSKRIVTRFDAGDTIIRLNQQARLNFGFFPYPGTFPVAVISPAKTTHNFQFSASVGFRF